MTNTPAPRSDQIAPHSVEAEEAVIGAAILRPDIVGQLAAIVEPADFFIIRHQLLWNAIIALKDDGAPIDYLTIVSHLEMTNKLEDVGGVAYILGLQNKTPSALNAVGYARIVENHATRRRILDAASQMARVAHSDETDIETVVQKSEEAVMRVTATRKRHHIKTATETGDEFDQWADDLLAGNGVDYGTPWKALDGIVGPEFLKSTYALVTGDSEHMKSTVTRLMMQHWLDSGQWVYLVTQEDSSNKVWAKLACANTGVPFDLWLSRDDSISPERWFKVPQWVHEHKRKWEGRLYMQTDQVWAANIKADMQALTESQGRSGILIVDTINKTLDATQHPRGVREGINKASAGFERIKQDVDALVVVIAQNRLERQRSLRWQDHLPDDGTIAESANLMRDPDVILATVYGDKLRKRLGITDPDWFKECPPAHIYIKKLKGRNSGSGMYGTLGVNAATGRVLDPVDMPIKYRTEYSGVQYGCNARRKKTDNIEF